MSNQSDEQREVSLREAVKFHGVTYENERFLLRLLDSERARVEDAERAGAVSPVLILKPDNGEESFYHGMWNSDTQTYEDGCPLEGLPHDAPEWTL